MDFKISSNERERLRVLATKQKEASQLSIMDQRRKLWFDHNELRSTVPVVVMETKYCEQDLFDLECTSPFAREIEHGILRFLMRYELVNDDTVVPDFYEINWDINILELGLDMSEQRAEDDDGNSIGYETIHHLEDLEESFDKIKETERSVDKALTLRRKEEIENIIGDILPVKIKNQPQLNWYTSPSKKVVYLMGTESMMIAPYDCPYEFKELYRLLVKSALDTYDWLIENDLLCLNNDNDYAGSGTYGFTTELPTEEYKNTGKISTKDLWCNLNSQETVSVSSEMYGEYYYPYYKELAEQFGQVYYGCCEPVNDVWDEYICNLPNLRKVSVSPWADLEFMRDRLSGSNVIYSRKPSPNLLAIKNSFDEDKYREHIEESVIMAQGCHTEIVCRDVYALYGERNKLGRAVEIIRESIDKYWRY